MGNSNVISALEARTNFGRLLRQVEGKGKSLVIEKRGTPRAVLLSLQDYVRLAVPEPEILTIIGRNSQRRGTDKLTPRQIRKIIEKARRSRR